MLPGEKELLIFIEKKNNFVNFSMIAKHFEINNATVKDFIATLEKKKLVTVQKLGGQKIVVVKK